MYVAGPFRGPNAWAIENNIREAEVIGFEVAQAGAMPLIPHANTRFFHGTLTDAFWLEGTMELLRRCDAAIFSPRWVESSGATAERMEARDLGIPCFDSIEELRSWLAAR